MKVRISKLLLLSLVLLVLRSEALSIRLNRQHKQSHLAYKDNLEAINWYYGNISEADYRVRIFKTATTETVYTCPLDSPYASADLSRCESCPPERPLRNLGKYSCEACPAGSVYLNDQGNCSAASGVINSTVVQPTVTDPVTGVTDEDDDNIAPLVVPPTQDETQQTDNDCEQFEELVDGKCEPFVYVPNPSAPNQIQPEANYTSRLREQIEKLNPTKIIKVCPSERPYLKGSSCIRCDENELFNVSSQQCTTGCPKGTIYDKNKQMCFDGTLLTDPESFNLVSPSGAYEQWKNKTLALKETLKNAQFCPGDTPYSIEGRCLRCPDETPYFNIDVGECEGCQNGRYYSPENRACLSWYSDDVSLRRMVSNIF